MFEGLDLSSIALFRWQDAVDVFIITVIFYLLIAWFRRTRALQIFIGLLSLLIFTLIARKLQLVITSWLLQGLGAVSVILVIVIFQQEIKEVLLYANPLRALRTRHAFMARHLLPELARTVFEMAGQRLGAIIVIGRSDPLEGVTREGTDLDGRFSGEILWSIFHPSSPVHDGAVLLKEDRIARAGCFLPVSTHPDLPRTYGTRHRAAVGLAEDCDALAIVVSEERGSVSLAVNKEIHTVSSPETLVAELDSLLVPSPEPRLTRTLRAVTRDLPVKAAVLVAVTIFWFLFGAQREVLTVLTVPVEFRNLPKNFELMKAEENEVTIHVAGGRELVKSLKEAAEAARIDLADAAPGYRYYEISPKNFYLPPGVSIRKILPSSIRVFLEEKKTKTVPVVPTFEGDFPEGIAAGMARIEPAMIDVVAPVSVLKTIKRLRTEPIDAGALTHGWKKGVRLEFETPALSLAPGASKVVTIEFPPLEVPAPEEEKEEGAPVAEKEKSKP